MILTYNTSGRDLIIIYNGIPYPVPNEAPVQLPETAAALYFGWGVETTEDIIRWCVDRLKLANSELMPLSEKDVWEEICQKVKFGDDAVELIKKGRKKGKSFDLDDEE